MRRPAPPSGSRSAYCLTLPKAVLHSLGECQDQVPGDPPAALGDLARHRASNFPIALSRQSLLTTCDDSPLNAKHCPAAPSSNPGTLPTMQHQPTALRHPRQLRRPRLPEIRRTPLMTPNAMVMTCQGSVTRIRELAHQLALCLKQASKIILVVLTLIHVKPSGSRHVRGGVLSSVFFDLHTKIKVLDGDVSANTKDFSHGFPPRF